MLIKIIALSLIFIIEITYAETLPNLSFGPVSLGQNRVSLTKDDFSIKINKNEIPRIDMF